MHCFPEGRERETYRLLRLNGVDVHLGARIGEVDIKVKHVVVVHFFSHRTLLQHLLVRTRKALQRPC